MISRPVTIGSFEFVVVSSLRAAQLMRGCTPRVATSLKPSVTAQREVAAGTVARLPPDPALARKHGL
jgi:DNA-directed RNA polymerase subunit K/omega